MPQDDGTYECMFKRADEFICVYTDTLYYKEGDKVKKEEIDKLR